MFFKRNIIDEILRALKRSPAILIGGARQVGKTSLLKKMGGPLSYSYTTLDDLESRSYALEHPKDFIETLTKPAIIDEVQRASDLPLAIKKDIDEHRIPGRYALAGSTNPILLPKLSDALVGRMAILRMYPLSQGELIGHKETFIEQLFSDKPTFKFSTLSKQEVCQKMVMGGYPSVQELSEKDRENWFKDYLDTILQRDVQELSRIEGLSDMPKLLQLIADRVGNILNVASIRDDAKLSTATMHRYITLLEKVFLIVFQPSWSNNFGTRVIKSPKVYFVDTGLLTGLLRMNVERLASSTHIGKVLENFVVQELLKQMSWASINVSGYYFRTVSNIEIDIVLENMMGELVAIEVKAATSVSQRDIHGIRYFKEQMGANFKRGIVLYLGDHIIPFEKNIEAIPISSLWES